MEGLYPHLQTLIFAGEVSQGLFSLIFFHSIGAWTAQWIFRWKDCVLRSSYRRMQAEIL